MTLKQSNKDLEYRFIYFKINDLAINFVDFLSIRKYVDPLMTWNIYYGILGIIIIYVHMYQDVYLIKPKFVDTCRNGKEFFINQIMLAAFLNQNVNSSQNCSIVLKDILIQNMKQYLYIYFYEQDICSSNVNIAFYAQFIIHRAS